MSFTAFFDADVCPVVVLKGTQASNEAKVSGIDDADSTKGNKIRIGLIIG